MEITNNINKIIVDGEELPFVEVKVSNWNDGSVAGYIVRTHEKIKKYYDALWSQDELPIEVYYKDGSLQIKLAKVIAVKDGTNGQYEYHFFGK